MAEETSFFSKKKGQRLAWKLAVVWFVLFSINSLCTSIIGALAGKYWSMIDVQDRFIIFLCVIGSWTGTIMAFLFNTARSLAKGENPLGETDVETTTVVTTATKIDGQTAEPKKD